MSYTRALIREASGWASLLAACTIALLWAAPAAAQQSHQRLSVDPRAGVAFPVGDLADVHEAGFTGGVGLAYAFHPNVAVRGDLDVSVLDDESQAFGVVLAPTLTMVHFHGGLEFDFVRPGDQALPLTLRWGVGGGGTSMSASREFPDGEDVNFSQTYPSVNSAVKIGYAFSSGVEAFVDGRMNLVFADELEVAELVKRIPNFEPFGTIWSAPVTAGVKLTF